MWQRFPRRVVSAVHGRHAVDRRGELSLPLGCRELCGITTARPVVLAGYPTGGRPVIKPGRHGGQAPR
jgi:hypothetical protein